VSRSLSLTFRAAAYAEHTGEIVITLVTIEHDSLPGPLRFSSDPTHRISVDPLVYGTESRGESFVFLPMSLVLPDDNDDAAPALKLTLDNVSRDTIPTIRSVSDPATVTVEFVLASAPDVVEASWPEFDLVNAEYDALQVPLDLVVNALATEPYPAGTFSPASFPGLF
jgi:hypothetical protein